MSKQPQQIKGNKKADCIRQDNQSASETTDSQPIGNESMSTLAQTTEIVKFNNHELLTLKVGEIIYTAIRPIVEGIGLDWASQYAKLKKNAVKFGCCDIATPTKGGVQNMLCMPIKKLNGWLFSINPEKVKPEIKDDVIAYQEECFEALYNYWHKGEAVNPRASNPKTTTEERTPLRQAVTALVGKAKIKHDDAYNMVNQFMGTNHIWEIPKEDLPKAVAYVHSLTLVAGRASHPLDAYALTNLKALVTHNFLMVSFFNTVKEPIKMLNHNLWASFHQHFWEAKSTAIMFNRQFDLGVDERYLLPYRC